MEPDFSKLHISYEAGRASFFYHTNIVARFMSKPHERWPVSFGIIIPNKDNQCTFYVVYKNETDFDKYLNEYLKSGNLFSELYRYIGNEVRTDVNLINSTDLKNATNGELSKVLAEHYTHFTNLIATAWVLRAVDRSVVNRLKYFFPKNDDFNSIFSVISISEKKSFAAEKEDELLRIALLLKGKKVPRVTLEKAVRPVYEKYKHATVGYFTESAETFDTYVQQTLSYTKDVEKKLREKTAKEKEELQRKQEVLFHHALTSNQHLVLQAGAESAWYKDFYKFNVNKIIFAAEPLFEQVAVRTGVNSDLIKDMTWEETSDLLQGKKVDLDFIKERIRHSIFVVYAPYIKLLVGKEADAFEQTYLKFDLSASIFKGRVACRGKVSGPVKIVLGPKDFPKVNHGDIIVVSNTSPDFVPVLGRVSGIIAEEGGVTAHVSVISRELGIPAVIGVRCVTTVLNDGMVVELNADKGIVKIIK